LLLVDFNDTEAVEATLLLVKVVKEYGYKRNITKNFKKFKKFFRKTPKRL
jgi:hypothetical protein